MATRRRDVRAQRKAIQATREDMAPKAARVVNPKDGVRFVLTPKKSMKKE